MSKIMVLMTVICSVPGDTRTLKEAWRIEERVTLEHCLLMNKVFAQAGKYASMTVRCNPDE